MKNIFDTYRISDFKKKLLCCITIFLLCVSYQNTSKTQTLGVGGLGAIKLAPIAQAQNNLAYANTAASELGPPTTEQPSQLSPSGEPPSYAEATGAPEGPPPAYEPVATEGVSGSATDVTNAADAALSAEWDAATAAVDAARTAGGVATDATTTAAEVAAESSADIAAEGAGIAASEILLPLSIAASGAVAIYELSTLQASAAGSEIANAFGMSNQTVTGINPYSYQAVQAAQALANSPQTLQNQLAQKIGNLTGSPLIILYASYGNNEQASGLNRINVTSNLPGVLSSHNGTVPANQYLSLLVRANGWPDPAPGTLKSLFVIYQQGNSIYAALPYENETLTLPSPNNILNVTTAQTNKGFKLLCAYYGTTAGGFIYATPNGSQPVAAGNTVYAGSAGMYGTAFANNMDLKLGITQSNDPAYGHIKGLIVVFLYDRALYVQMIRSSDTGSAATISTATPSATLIPISYPYLTFSHASYGNHNVSGTVYNDVTGAVNILYTSQNNSLSIAANNAITYFPPDPAPGIVKTLFMIYTLFGQTSYYVSCNPETIPIFIPSNGGGPGVGLYTSSSSDTGFQVLKAWYGDLTQLNITQANIANITTSSSHVRDVTAITQGMVQNNVILYSSNSKNQYYGDPAPGIAKGLFVIFRAEQDLYFQTLSETDPGPINLLSATPLTSSASGKQASLFAAMAGWQKILTTSTATTFANNIQSLLYENTPIATANIIQTFQITGNTLYDTAFMTVLNDFTNGLTAGNTAGTTAAQGAIAANTTTGSVAYQTGYTTAYNTAFYTATRGTSDGTAAGQNTTTTPAVSATGYTAYDNAYNAVASSAYNGYTSGTSDVIAGKTAITSAPTTATNATSYMNAYNSAYNDYKLGIAAGKYYGSAAATSKAPLQDTLVSAATTAATQVSAAQASLATATISSITAAVVAQAAQAAAASAASLATGLSIAGAGGIGGGLSGLSGITGGFGGI